MLDVMFVVAKMPEVHAADSALAPVPLVPHMPHALEAAVHWLHCCLRLSSNVRLQFNICASPELLLNGCDPLHASHASSKYLITVHAYICIHTVSVERK